MTLDMATAAPFCLQWWTRRVVIPLPTVLHVAPRCGAPIALPAPPNEHTGDSTRQAIAQGGEPRGARPYRAGDNPRHVHWQASAHTGELMVRELERPSAEPVTVIVELPTDPEEAEHVAERALGTAVRLLDRGAPVLLRTTELSGPVVALVGDRRGAGRRLGRAVAGADSGDATEGVVVSG